MVYARGSTGDDESALPRDALAALAALAAIPALRDALATETMQRPAKRRVENEAREPLLVAEDD